MKIKNNNDPFISICIASYNYEKYLLRGFNSIKKQKFHDYEIIYLDDASEDNSAKIIKKIIIDNPTIPIKLRIHNKNKGLLSTKTELLYMASGRYVMLCDADDWMADNCLELLSDKALKSNADRIISEVYDINADNKILQIQDFAETPSKWLWNIHHGCLYKRDIVEKNRLKILLYPDDVYFTTLFNLYSSKTEWIKQPLYYWYIHQDSSGHRKKGNIQDVIENFSRIAAFLRRIEISILTLEDKNEIRLLIIKMYYLQLFHEIKPYSLSDKLRSYFKLHKIILTIYPSYMDNIFFSQKYFLPARKYAMQIMHLGRFLEKVHVMPFALIGYHVLSKWIEFDQ